MKWKIKYIAQKHKKEFNKISKINANISVISANTFGLNTRR